MSLLRHAGLALGTLLFMPQALGFRPCPTSTMRRINLKAPFSPGLPCWFSADDCPQRIDFVITLYLSLSDDPEIDRGEIVGRDGVVIGNTGCTTWMPVGKCVVLYWHENRLPQDTAAIAAPSPKG